MKLNKCLICGTERPDNSNKCPKCGFVYHEVNPLGVGDDILGYDRNEKQASEVIDKINSEEKEWPAYVCGFGSFFVITWLIMVICEWISRDLSTSIIMVFVAMIISGFIALPIGAWAESYFNKDTGKIKKEILYRQIEYTHLRESLKKQKKDQQTNLYGEPDRIIQISQTKHVKAGVLWMPEEYGSSNGETLKIYQNHRLFIYDAKVVKFDDIINVSLDDETMNTYSYSEEHRNTSNVIGRSVVGGMLAGNVGAAIGGLTSDKEIKTDSDGLRNHNLVVNISVVNIKDPLIRICFGDNIEQARIVYATLLACKRS